MQHYQFMKSLVRRINENDPEFTKIQEEFYRLEAGVAGETRLRECLSDYHFKHDYSIIYNYETMNSRGFSHQIDAIVITSHFILILEVKQLTGLLYYKPSIYEFSREHPDGSVENLTNPFDQVYRHKIFIESILDDHAITIPVLHHVVISNYRARLHSSVEKMPIIHLSGLPTYLDRLFLKFPKLSYKVADIRELFLRMNSPLKPRRKVNRHQIRTGVFCNKCAAPSPMKFYYGYWRCDECNNRSFDVVLSALHDYRTLISEVISNQDFRWFTHIESRFAASRILARLLLEAEGEKKSRKYFIPVDILDRSFER